MKRYGIVSYNIHGNYVNYGSVLQSYALQTAINKFDSMLCVVLDYWPDAICGKDPLNPLKAEKNATQEFVDMVTASMPAIVENYRKTQQFIEEYYALSKTSYTQQNFEKSSKDEKLDGYIVGSDAIWMVDFFGWDSGFWGEFDCMKQSNTIAYAASFGESNFDESKEALLCDKVKNFKAIGIREPKYQELIRKSMSGRVEQVVDPTLLLGVSEYDRIAAKRLVDEPYILIYSRKYNRFMDDYADALAEEFGYKVVEISLRAQNSDRHMMYYNAGMEEFLSLIKHAENVVTNSLHASIFSTLYHRPISFFNRGNANYKVEQFLKSYGLERMIVQNNEKPLIRKDVDYGVVDDLITCKRKQSLDFLKESLE